MMSCLTGGGIPLRKKRSTSIMLRLVYGVLDMWEKIRLVLSDHWVYFIVTWTLIYISVRF
jgi:hypothetical protein